MRKGILLFLIILLTGCNNLSDDVIARVGDYTITKAAVLDMLSRRHPGQKSFKNVPIDQKKKLLEDMLEQQMKIQDALAAGYDDSVKNSNRYKFYKLRLGNQAYFQKHVLNVMFPEKVVHDFFEKQKEVINVAHVLIGFKGSRVPNKRSKEDALKLARTITSKARSGKNFRVLAVKYSDDPSVKKNYGEIGTFGWGELAPAFQEAAFNMQPGTISDPVLTIFGYHVIKLLKKIPNPRWKEENYAREKKSILQDLYQQHADSGRKLMDHTIIDLIKKYHFKMNGPGITAMAKTCQALKKAGRLNRTSFTKEQLATIVAQWDGKTLTVKDVLPLYGVSLDRASGLLTSEPKLGEDLNRKAKGELLLFLSEKEGLFEEAGMKKKLQDFINSRMIHMLERHEVAQKIKMDQKEKEDYYIKHKSEFILPARMELWEITAKNKTDAQRIYKKARAGADFSKLARKYSTDKLFSRKGGYIGFRAIKARGVVSEQAFKAGPHKILKPFTHNKKWVVVKTGALKPSVVRSYEDVANQVRIKLRQQKTRERRKAWKKELFKRHSYTINEGALAAL